MTPTEAAAKGYVIDWASPLAEVGLIKNGKGIRTWWGIEICPGRFELPSFDHPLIQEAIEIAERNPGIWP